MERKRRRWNLKEKEVAHVIPIREGEEIRFSVIELDGRPRADIRYFAQWGGVDEMQATTRGIIINPEKFDDFVAGVTKLRDRVQKSDE
jgi:hypothetical protein